MIQTVLAAYGFNENDTDVQTFGNGLINTTWKVISGDNTYILQKVNSIVFKQPPDIAHNLRLIKDHLAEHHPEYRFVSPVVSANGEEMIFVQGQGFFRMFPFIKDSHTKDVVETPEQAHEAAVQFGRFTRLLSGIDPLQLKIAIPGFHDLSLRYRQFEYAMKNGNKEIIEEAKALIATIEENIDILRLYEKLRNDPAFRLRIIHHDTKISNVLFDNENKGLCVIDLDTIMPGYFISDVGDMMRTYLSPVNEEEKDLDKIVIRDEFYKAIVAGYLEEMKDELTETERKHFFYAGKFMIYMQALRFLTDHINNNMYYREIYPGHNLDRTRNQVTLLSRLIEAEEQLAIQ